MIRKISFCFFMTLFCCAVSAQEAASPEKPSAQNAPVFDSVTESRRDFASLKQDVESSVAKLEELRRLRDESDGEQKNRLAAQVDAVYSHLSQLRREVADFALRTETMEAQRRLDAQRQQRSLSLQHSAMQRRMLEQQRLLQQQEQQRRMSRLNS